MNISQKLVRSQIAGLLVVLLACPFGNAATPPQQPAPASSQQQTASQQPVGAQDSGVPAPTPAAALPQAPAKQTGPGTSSASQAQQKSETTKPLGTAAAPSTKTMGVTASQPAGAVIAPAKQRRTRAILIRVGLLVGAGIAIGTVMALSHASPSRP